VTSRLFFREAQEFLQQLAQKFKRGQSVVNTAMVFVQKCALIVPFEELNRFLLSASAFLLAAKTADEPISLAALAETYCVLEQSRN